MGELIAQVPHAIIMLRPAQFGYNVETASSNAFQYEIDSGSEESVAQRALREFDDLVAMLKAQGVEVYIFDEVQEHESPDAVFLNNWFSTHPDGTLVIYPMLAASRRRERRADIIELLKAKYVVEDVLDLSGYENAGIFLEGTGSIIFDHQHGVAYASASARTNKELFEKLCRRLDYQPVSFNAFDENGEEIYHTNVLMNICEHFVVVCLESIWEPERDGIRQMLEHAGLEVVDISFEQLKSFAGNVIQVAGAAEETFLVMSERACSSLSDKQKDQIGRYTSILTSELGTIETYGGGGARCMIAGIHLPILPDFN